MADVHVEDSPDGPRLNLVGDDAEVLVRHRGEPLKALQHVVEKALEKDRSARYQSAGEMLAELAELQNAKRRRPIWATRLVMALGALALIAAVAMTIVALRRFGGEAPNILQRQVTANPVNDSVYMAAISPDGKNLAYTDLLGVHVRLLEGGAVYNLPMPPHFCFR